MIVRAASFLASEVASAVGGRLDEGQLGANARFRGVATDTRDALEGCLFVALHGRRYDAHRFLGQAVDGGAAGLLVTQSSFESVGSRQAVGDDIEVVLSPDSLLGLGALAHFHRKRMGTPVIALTGSNGKTSTKDMMAAVLGVGRRVLSTEGNLNNLVGLPLTLLGLEAHHEVCVAEMGMNARGEIAQMVAIASPDVGLVTNIGPAHIGALGSLENIASAKGEMFRGLGPDAIAVVNLDDARVREQAELGGVPTWRTFGRDPEADVRVLSAHVHGSGTRVVLSIDGAPSDIELAVPGAHAAVNAAAAVAGATALTALAPSREAIRQGLGDLLGTRGRLSVRRLGKLTVIDDSYNANLASALAAVEVAQQVAGRRRLVVAFGEMHELGSHSESAHREIGEALAHVGAQVVAAYGEGAEPLAAAANGSVRHEASDFEALSDWLMEQLEDGDVVLVKGSRASRMERIVSRLEDLN